MFYTNRRRKADSKQKVSAPIFRYLFLICLVSTTIHLTYFLSRCITSSFLCYLYLLSESHRRCCLLVFPFFNVPVNPLILSIADSLISGRGNHTSTTNQKERKMESIEFNLVEIEEILAMIQTLTNPCLTKKGWKNEQQ